MQTEATLNAFGQTVNIGKNTSNETRLFVRTIEPVSIQADMDICGNLMTQDITVDGSLNIGPNSIPADAIIGGVSSEGGSTGPTGSEGFTGPAGAKGQT